MEVLTLFGTEEHKRRWLQPLLEGTIRSAFAMTEPAVASSDATNIEPRMDRDGNGFLLNGRKWFASNAMHPNCRVLVVMGKTDPTAAPHRQQSMVVVPIDASGVRVVRSLFGSELGLAAFESALGAGDGHPSSEPEQVDFEFREGGPAC